MREDPTSLLDETTVEVVSTTGTIVAPTTGITEKAGGVTIAMTSEANALATTTMRLIRSSVPTGGVTTRKTTTRR